MSSREGAMYDSRASPRSVQVYTSAYNTCTRQSRELLLLLYYTGIQFGRGQQYSTLPSLAFEFSHNTADEPFPPDQTTTPTTTQQQQYYCCCALYITMYISTYASLQRVPPMARVGKRNKQKDPQQTTPNNLENISSTGSRCVLLYTVPAAVS